MDVSSRAKLMMSCEEVALITVKALEKNRAIIIPGWRNRLLALARAWHRAGWSDGSVRD